MNAVLTDIGASGKLVIGTSGLSGATGVLATLPLAATAGTVSGDVLTLNAVTASTVTGAGTQTAALAEIRNSADATIISGLTVGVSGANINLTTVSLANGAAISITSGTITHATV
jgi:hypothetical protein